MNRHFHPAVGFPERDLVSTRQVGPFRLESHLGSSLSNRSQRMGFEPGESVDLVRPGLVLVFTLKGPFQVFGSNPIDWTDGNRSMRDGLGDSRVGWRRGALDGARTNACQASTYFGIFRGPRWPSVLSFWMSNSHRSLSKKTSTWHVLPCCTDVLGTSSGSSFLFVGRSKPFKLRFRLEASSIIPDPRTSEREMDGLLLTEPGEGPN